MRQALQVGLFYSFHHFVVFLSAVDEAVEILAKLEKVDPYRLENMDTYSNLLYVKVSSL